MSTGLERRRVLATSGWPSASPPSAASCRRRWVDAANAWGSNADYLDRSCLHGRQFRRNTWARGQRRRRGLVAPMAAERHLVVANIEAGADPDQAAGQRGVADMGRRGRRTPHAPSVEVGGTAFHAVRHADAGSSCSTSSTSPVAAMLGIVRPAARSPADGQPLRPRPILTAPRRCRPGAAAVMQTLGMLAATAFGVRSSRTSAQHRSAREIRRHRPRSPLCRRWHDVPPAPDGSALRQRSCR